MILLGILLLLLGYFLSIGILYTLGWIALIIGIILWLLGAFNHPVGGRRYWY